MDSLSRNRSQKDRMTWVLSIFQFSDEERGKCIDDYSISIYRRWNHENNITAILCRVDHPETEIIFQNHVFKEAMDYAIQKLKQGNEDDATSIINLKIFYSVAKNIESSYFLDYFENHTKDLELSYTFVPVLSLRNKQTFLSICGVKLPWMDYVIRFLRWSIV